MHNEAYQWAASFRTDEPVSILDIGGRDINGTPRDLFPNASTYDVLDIRPGPNVDIVADAANWIPDREYDLLICMETFEHTDVWPQICATAYEALRPGGKAILTMAGPGRPPHSAIDGGWTLHDGEYYGNVSPNDLQAVLTDCGFVDVVTDYRPSPADTRAVATKPA